MFGGSLFFWTHCTIAVESGLTLAVDEVWWELEAGVAAAGVAAVAVDATLLTTSIPLGTLVHICSRARITETHTCTVLLHAVITSTMIDSSLAVRTDVEPGNSAQLIHVSDRAGAVLGQNIGGLVPPLLSLCYFNVRSKADTSQLNLPHGTDNLKSVKTEKKIKSKKTDMLRSNSKQSGKSI